MDSLDGQEIYIPVEAEVISSPLSSLPASILRKMGLPKGSKNITGSPDCIWISPAVIRRKGQKVASHTGKNAEAQGRGGELQTLHMSFVSPCRVAYTVLKDIAHSEKIYRHRSHSSLLCQGQLPRTYRNAVVIYQGCIYLIIRNRSLRQSRRERGDPQPADWSSFPPASSFKSQKKLINDNWPKKKHIQSKVTHVENKGITHPVGDVSSSQAACSDGHCHKDVRGQQMGEEAAGAALLEPDWIQPVGAQEVGAYEKRGDCEMQDLGGEKAESTTQVKECDYDELVQEERIAQVKARLRQNEALSNL